MGLNVRTGCCPCAGLIADSAPCIWANTVLAAGAGRATSHAQWQGAAYSTRGLSIAGSAVRFPVTYMRELMNMIPSSHTGTGSKT